MCSSSFICARFVDFTFSSFLKEIPEAPIEVYNEDGCVVDLMFYAEFSNVLLVKARVQEGNESSVSFVLNEQVNWRLICEKFPKGW